MEKLTALIEYRMSLNFTISQMALKIGVSRSFYEKIEYGNRSPSYNFLKKFKNAFPSADAEQIFLPTNYTNCCA